jgi:effector-binding domain-containing protein
VGDNVYGEGEPDEFPEAWRKPFGWVTRAGVTIVASLGNHDV